MGNWHDKTLALAAMFQAASLVKDLATTGLMEQHDFETCIGSIMITDPESTEAIFNGSRNINTGLQVLIEQLDKNDKKRNIDIARYVISLLHLQAKLAKNKAMLEQLANGIDRAKAQSEHFGIHHENVIANLAGVYSDTISHIQPKIMVSGEERFLSNPATANKIRALLLAGMRSAVLWRQLGGSRWQILLQRKRIVREAQAVLSTSRQLH